MRTTRGVTIWRKPVTNHPLGFLRGDGIISGFTPAQVHAAISSFSARAVCTRQSDSAIAAQKKRWAAVTQTTRGRCRLSVRGPGDELFDGGELVEALDADTDLVLVRLKGIFPTR